MTQPFTPYRQHADRFDILFVGGPLDGAKIQTDVFPDCETFTHRVRKKTYCYRYRRISQEAFEAKFLGFGNPIPPSDRRPSTTWFDLFGRKWNFRMKYRVTEKEIREQLGVEGFEGESAVFENLRLTAVERPGWVQVFEFSLSVKDTDADLHRFFGAFRHDGRAEQELKLFRDETERDAFVEDWKQGLITLERTNSKVAFGLILVAVVALGLAVLSSLLSAT